MQALVEKKWGKFSAFGENGLFRIETTNSSIDSVRIKKGVETVVPYITRSNESNGIARFVSDDNYENGSDEGGCITVGLDTQTAFYQPYKFVTGQNVHIITGKQLNGQIAQFLVMILRKQMRAKFNWGGNGATLGRMKHLIIMLPVTASGDPDYNYMAQYSSKLRSILLKQYKYYVAEQISNLDYREIPALDEKRWDKKRIGELFKISRPNPRSKDNYEIGDIPFVASGAINNGVVKYCAVCTEEKLDAANCITVSPVDGSSFYQPIDFLGRGGAGSSIIILRNDDLNLFRGEFMARMIKQTCSKYNYGHMGNKDSIKREQIMFPVDDAGNPDYNYMEQYSKNMLLRKYHQYLDFLTHPQSSNS